MPPVEKMYPAAGVKWVARRCKEARVIVISKSATSVNASDISGALIGAIVQNPALSEFLLYADSLSLKPTTRGKISTV
ncbi:hypothetical protein WJX75_002627 [Coccomyxa subellipsoidea]|uniref:Uncharacterized protein n=1 Tax=Coccomyxa subellipsoidea TaxID=248742 RepID=A0ABR2YDT1_9CHLO